MNEQSSLAVRKEHTLAVLAKAIRFVEVTEERAGSTAFEIRRQAT
jgi:hypothetical protein